MQDTIDRNELLLMQGIHALLGAKIHTAAGQSSIPEHFVAALVANESGGNLAAKRFEPGVLISLWEVLLGRKTNFGSIGRAELIRYVAKSAGVFVPANLPADAFQRVDALATSWGYTQIMGYNAMAEGKTIDTLQDPVGSLDFTIVLLARFIHTFQLDPRSEFKEMFECWNGGHPGAKTADPQYVANGNRRAQIYAGILQVPPAPLVQTA